MEVSSWTRSPNRRTRCSVNRWLPIIWRDFLARWLTCMLKVSLIEISSQRISCSLKRMRSNSLTLVCQRDMLKTSNWRQSLVLPITWPLRFWREITMTSVTHGQWVFSCTSLWVDTCHSRERTEWKCSRRSEIVISTSNMLSSKLCQTLPKTSSISSWWEISRRGSHLLKLLSINGSRRHWRRTNTIILWEEKLSKDWLTLKARVNWSKLPWICWSKYQMLRRLSS